MDRIIKVTGRGKLSVKPDTTCLRLELEGTEPEYNDALRRSAELTESLRTTLEGFGFARSELKTRSSGVEAVYESYQAKDRSWKKRFIGYRFNHRMKVEFPSDNERLGKVLYALGHCDAKPEISIEYTVADKEAVKNELLAKAVKDARAKAAILTESAGAALGRLVSIDYSWGELELVSRPMDRMLMADCAEPMEAGGSYDLDVEPDDIDVTDTVTVVWEL